MGVTRSFGSGVAVGSPRGQSLGMIVDPGTFRFSAVVLQDEASNLFVDRIRKAEVRLVGQAETSDRGQSFFHHSVSSRDGFPLRLWDCAAVAMWPYP